MQFLSTSFWTFSNPVSFSSKFLFLLTVMLMHSFSAKSIRMSWLNLLKSKVISFNLLPRNDINWIFWFVRKYFWSSLSISFASTVNHKIFGIRRVSPTGRVFSRLLAIESHWRFSKSQNVSEKISSISLPSNRKSVNRLKCWKLILLTCFTRDAMISSCRRFGKWVPMLLGM